MMVNVRGMTAPAPTPWIPRNQINCVIVCENPDNADPRRNNTTPMEKMIFRPNRSASFP